jgi:hypothetical protein
MLLTITAPLSRSIIKRAQIVEAGCIGSSTPTYCWSEHNSIIFRNYRYHVRAFAAHPSHDDDPVHPYGSPYSELNARSIKMPSFRGNDTLCHVALTVFPEENQRRHCLPSSTAPVHAPLATGPQITETNRQYLTDTQEFNV